MILGTAGLELIKHFEGFRATPYVCPGNKLTIGYGHTATTRPDMHVTKAEAEALLHSDVQGAERAVARLIRRRLPQNQFDALVSFTFNLGAGALQRSTLRQKVNRMEDVAAAREFRKWVWAGGRKQRGLIRRRDAEASLFAALPW